MRALRFPLALAIMVPAACQPHQAPFTQSQRDATEAEVREAVGQLTAAMNARNADGVLSFYRDSREFVFVGCTDLIFGSEAFTGVVGPYWESRPEAAVQRDILRIQVLGPETAVVTLQSSSPDTSSLFWTQVLVRETDGRWLIAHEHQSWPGCPDPVPLHAMGDMPDPGNPPEGS